MNDKQFTDELFKRMYYIGYRKAEIEDDTLFFFVNKRDCSCLFSPRVPVKSTCFEEKDQLIDVGEYLGIVDWNNVKIDTPILVSLDNETWLCRYFAAFKNGIIYTWSSGATSWSVRKREYQDAWSFAKLAEV